MAATLSLNAGAFLGGVASARRGLTGLVTGLAGVVGVTGGLAGAFMGLKSAMDLGGKLGDLSTITGVAVKDLTVLRQAFQDTGVGAEAVPTVIGMMQKSLSGMNEEGGRTSDVFGQLGLDMGALRNLPPTEALQKIGAAINTLGSESDRTAATMAIFGRSGAQLKTFFAEGQAIEIAKRSLGDLPDIMQRNAELFDKVSDSLGRIKSKGVGLFAGMAEGIAPALQQITTSIDGLDLSGIGLKIGEALAAVVELFQSGQLGEVMKLSLSAGFKSAINVLASGMYGAGTGLLAMLTNSSLWAGVGKMALGAFQGIGSALLKIFMQPLTYLQAGMDTLVQKLFEKLGSIPKLGKMMGLEGFKAGSFEENLADREKNGFFLKDAAEASARQAKDLMASGVADTQKGLAEALDIMRNFEGVQIFDADADTAELKAKFEAALETVRKAREELQAAAAVPAPTGDGSLSGDKPKDREKKASDMRLDLSDRLSRIGGMMGGAAGLDLQRATARATERAARASENLYRLVQRSPGSFQAVPTYQEA